MNELINAYKETDFIVYDPAIVIKVSQANSLLDELLLKNQATVWAYITAWNPYSELTDKNLNEERNDQLHKDIRPYKFFEGEGVGRDPSWEPEKSFLILGISREEAIRFGKKYRQNAIVVGNIYEAAELLCIKE